MGDYKKLRAPNTIVIASDREEILPTATDFICGYIIDQGAGLSQFSPLP